MKHNNTDIPKICLDQVSCHDLTEVAFSRIYGQVCEIVTNEGGFRYTKQERSPYLSYVLRKVVVLPVITMALVGGSIFSYQSYTFSGAVRGVESTLFTNEDYIFSVDDELLTTDYSLATFPFEETL